MKRILVFSFLLAAAVCARAQLPGRNLEVEAQIEHDLRQVNPALVESFRNARIAYDRHDFAEAERLLRGVVEQAPKFDPALRRLGVALEHLGRRDEGMKLVGQALALNRSAANLASRAYLLALPAKGEASDADKDLALNLLVEARALPHGMEPDMLVIAGQLALETHAYAEADRTVALLQQQYPDLMETHYLAGVQAAVHENWITAENEIRAAEKRGLKPEAAQGLLDGGIHAQAVKWRWIYGVLLAILGWALGMLLLCGLGFLLSVVTLRQIEKSDPRVAVGAGEQQLRRIYRVVVNLTGLYYYVSLPVVLVLVILAAGVMLYGFLVAGYIPIKLTVLLVIGVFATIWTMGKSLFLRVPAGDPGRAVERADAAGLWALSESVAKDLNTRPIDEIRLTPGADVFVYERGTWREKVENRARRILVIGAGVLPGFKTAAFRSVLAHEYGHFSNRDTAGGDVALRVQNDMLKFYRAMVLAGQATWLNVAFHFLRFYHFIFRRISHGATRLQEVLADRVAALHYGPAAFEAGLRHVIRQNVEFDLVVDREVRQAVKDRVPVSNLYTAEAPTGDKAQAEFDKALRRPTTRDDTHPGPLDRFRLIAAVPEPAAPAPEGFVWDLFKDRETMMTEMMKEVEKNIARHRR